MDAALMIEVNKDGNGRPYVQWEDAPGFFKRAWVAPAGARDWAPVGRYLKIARCLSNGRLAGMAVSFPIYSDHPDDQVLVRCVGGMADTIGCVATQSVAGA